MKTSNQIARIEKAIELIESGAVTPMTGGRYSVRTERMNIQYTVTMTSCDCYDFTETLKGESPCKHMWAAIGATAALSISEIHNAKSVSELESVGRKYADAMKSMHESFVKIARSEYKSRHCALTSRTNGSGNAGEMLVKPQPKSNGRYCGIEV
jgi:SWIM zinc finger